MTSKLNSFEYLDGQVGAISKEVVHFNHRLNSLESLYGQTQYGWERAPLKAKIKAIKLVRQKLLKELEVTADALVEKHNDVRGEAK